MHLGVEVFGRERGGLDVGAGRGERAIALLGIHGDRVQPFGLRGERAAVLAVPAHGPVE